MDTDRIIKRGYNPYLVLGGEDAGTSMDVGLLVNRATSFQSAKRRRKSARCCWSAMWRFAGREP